MSDKKTHNRQVIDSYDYLANSASATDCTGLIPGGVPDEYERESYESVYHYQPPEIVPEDPDKKGSDPQK